MACLPSSGSRPKEEPNKTILLYQGYLFPVLGKECWYQVLFPVPSPPDLPSGTPPGPSPEPSCSWSAHRPRPLSESPWRWEQRGRPPTGPPTPPSPRRGLGEVHQRFEESQEVGVQECVGRLQEERTVFLPDVSSPGMSEESTDPTSPTAFTVFEMSEGGGGSEESPVPRTPRPPRGSSRSPVPSPEGRRG